jgi:hypothetical protein
MHATNLTTAVDDDVLNNWPRVLHPSPNLYCNSLKKDSSALRQTRNKRFHYCTVCLRAWRTWHDYQPHVKEIAAILVIRATTDM